jgi:hypothetical protein
MPHLTEIGTVLVFLSGVALSELLHWANRYFFDNRPASLVIKGAIMADVGVAFLFTVIAKNAAGRIVPDKGVTVATDNPAFVTSVADDGSAGSVTSAVEGSGNLTATDGTLTSATFPVTFADNKPATLEIVAA